MRPTRPLRTLVPALAVLALAGCGSSGASSSPPPSAPPTSIPPSSASATPTTSSAVAAPAEPCDFTIGEHQTSSESSGGSVSVDFGSDRRSVACMPGPEITLRIVRNAVEVSSGGAPKRLKAGQTADVGPYTVTVLSAQGTDSRVRLTPK